MEERGAKAKKSGLALGRPTFVWLAIIAAGVLLVLPVVTTFNEFLTSVVIKLHLYPILVDWVVPTEVRFIAGMLRPFGIDAAVSSDAVIITRDGITTTLNISWNCVGWQSFIMFGLTLLTGLQGPFSRRSKLECVLLGFMSIFLVNLVRMSLVGIIAVYFGRTAAIIFHDYGGTVMVILWLALFWYLSYSYILRTKRHKRGGAR